MQSSTPHLTTGMHLPPGWRWKQASTCTWKSPPAITRAKESCSFNRKKSITKLFRLAHNSGRQITPLKSFARFTTELLEIHTKHWLFTPTSEGAFLIL